MDRTPNTWKPYISENRQHTRSHKWSIRAAHKLFIFQGQHWIGVSLRDYGYVRPWIMRDYGNFDRSKSYGIRTH